MNPATFLTLSLVVLAPATAFVFGDHQPLYQTSLEDLSAETNAIDNAGVQRTVGNVPRRHKEKKNHGVPSASYEDSEEVRQAAIYNALHGRHDDQLSDSAESERGAIWHTHRTCRPPKRSSALRNVGRTLRQSVHTIWRQLNLTTGQYIDSKYNVLYMGVRQGIEERQYIPTWIPDQTDAIALRDMNLTSREDLSLALKTFDTGLQKFAVAFEQMIRDEVSQHDHHEREGALISTQNSLKVLLCEIDSAIASQGWTVTPRVPRAIMQPEERFTPDFTRRMLRDWGVLLRYRTFLGAWGSLIQRVYSAIAPIHGLSYSSRENFSA